MRRNAGFSIYELMVVIAIIAILSTIAVPGMLNWRLNHRMGSAAREIMSAIEFARSRAVRDDAPVSVNFNFADNTYAVVNQVGTTLRGGQMDSDLDLNNISLGAQVQFTGRGLPNVAGEVTIRYLPDASRERRVNVSIGGSTRIYTP